MPPFLAAFCFLPFLLMAVPSLRLRRAMEAAPPGARFTLLATDPMARIDVPFLMQEVGGRMINVEEVEGELENLSPELQAWIDHD